MDSMIDWLRQRAYLSPEREAIIAGSIRWTFREFDQQVTQAARRLITLNVQPRDGVALLMRNSASFAVLVHAISRIGAILVPLNIRLAPPELEWQVIDSGARLLLYDSHNAQAANQIKPTQCNMVWLNEFSDADLSELKAPDRIDLESIHSIIYTSGTTGKPKGAMLSYGNHWWNAIASALNLGTHHNDRWLACLPLFHVGGLAILLRSVIYGVPVIVHESFDPQAVNQAIDDEKITIISVVSTMLQRMLDARGDRPYPPSLRCVLLGGGPAPRPLLDACASRNIPVVQTYGLTEAASQVATLAPEDALRKLGSAGKPLFPNEIRIEDNEIVVRGPTIFKGYINRSDDATLRDGWLHTGDLGYLDDDGYLYVLDRRNDLIISGGENVYPAEVEAALMTYPAVQEAGVIGVPDDRWGQVAVAAVKLRDGETVSEDALRSFCGERLARYKVPAQIRFVDSLPRNASGKLLRRELAAQWTVDHA